MVFLEQDGDTICAMSTAPGVGGIAVIRVSGNEALKVVRSLASFLPAKPESHRLYFGNFKDSAGESLDEVLVSYFAQGKSFTGEETLEVSCHGSQFITSQILQDLQSMGARMAKPGEFTYRAFMNGRLDLTQAEAVLDLIESQSKKSARLALRQLQGEFAKVLASIEHELTGVLAHLEANIDFAAEDIEIASSKQLYQRVQKIFEDVDKLLATYKQGRLLKEGMQIALVGQPNVGKSSLLNALVNEERAIVTEVPGTTRDFVEGQIVIEGVPVTFVDTAGIRTTSDIVEEIGIRRTYEKIESVDFVFLLCDPRQPLTHLEQDLLSAGLKKQNMKLIFPKKDLWNEEVAFGFLKQIENFWPVASAWSVSATTGEGLDKLFLFLSEQVSGQSLDSSAVLANSRHYEGLKKLKEHLAMGLKLMLEESSPEFIAFELQEGLLSLHEILGKSYDDEVMDRVFKEFCLGK